MIQVAATRLPAKAMPRAKAKQPSAAPPEHLLQGDAAGGPPLVIVAKQPSAPPPAHLFSPRGSVKLEMDAASEPKSSGPALLPVKLEMPPAAPFTASKSAPAVADAPTVSKASTGRPGKAAGQIYVIGQILNRL
jgi:hypothetical protein